MNDTQTDLLPRRAFLRNAVCLVGAAGLAFGTHSAHAGATEAEPLPSAPLALGYWDGSRLVAADALAYGDADLCRTGVRVTVCGYTHGIRPLRAIKTHFPVDGLDTLLPFHAWTSTPHGNSRAAFLMPVLPEHGLLLSVEHGPETFCPLSVGSEAGTAKLRLGHYILATATPAWGAYRYEAERMSDLHGHGPLVRRSLQGPVPVSFDYAVLRVEQA